MRLTTIKLTRLQRGLLQVELAQRAQISRCRLSEVENGHITARPEELQRLAAALGVSVDVLREKDAA
jgi:transcriptional regulator with XRE-family HTH domain